MTTSGSQPFNDVSRDRVLSAAGGYAELGLPDMAWEEVNSLSDDERNRPEVQELILGLLICQHRWDEAIETGHRLCKNGSMTPATYIHTAYALHETGRTSEAQTTLLAGPESLRTEPVFYYNLACYLAVTGNLLDAEVALKTAFRMDASLRLHARIDPDLKDFMELI
jgi:predicted Zn-dependent protease